MRSLVQVSDMCYQFKMEKFVQLSFNSDQIIRTNDILLTNLFWPKYCQKRLFYSAWEKFLEFEAEDREFAKNLKALEQFIQTVKGQNNFR